MATFILSLLLRGPVRALAGYPWLAAADAVFAVALLVWLVGGFSTLSLMSPLFPLAVGGYGLGSRLVAWLLLSLRRERRREAPELHRLRVRGLVPASGLLVRGCLVLMAAGWGAGLAELRPGFPSGGMLVAGLAANAAVAWWTGQVAVRGRPPFAGAGPFPAQAARLEALLSGGAAVLVAIHLLVSNTEGLGMPFVPMYLVLLAAPVAVLLAFLLAALGRAGR